MLRPALAAIDTIANDLKFGGESASRGTLGAPRETGARPIAKKRITKKLEAKRLEAIRKRAERQATLDAVVRAVLESERLVEEARIERLRGEL